MYKIHDYFIEGDYRQWAIILENQINDDIRLLMTGDTTHQAWHEDYANGIAKGLEIMQQDVSVEVVCLTEVEELLYHESFLKKASIFNEFKNDFDANI